MVKKKTIALPVRDFALPCPLKGHIEINSGIAQLYASAQNAAKDGRDIHSRIQKQRKNANTAYQSEYKVAHKFETESFIFSVSGRIDGFLDGYTPLIEEIKTSTNSKKLIAQLLSDRQHPYVLQLFTYAHILYLEREVIPKTSFLVPTGSGDVEEIAITFKPEEYAQWLELRLAELEAEVQADLALRKRRQEMVPSLRFPFSSSRPGQTELIADLEEALSQKKQVLVQAPTGLGKTMGVMLPSLKDALSRGQRLIYVTPKNSQHALANEALKHINDAGADLRSVTLSAKAKMCLMEEVICNPEYCRFANNYYDKMAAGNLASEVFKESPIVGSSHLREFGEAHEVCPFELSLDAVAQADAVVCDYNYVFSPRNTLGRFTYSISKWPEMPDLVIDEAHNLPARAQDYYGRRLSSHELTEIARQLALSASAEAIEARALISQLTFKIADIGRLVGFKEAKISLGKEIFEASFLKMQELTSRRLAQAADLEGQASSRGADALMSLANYFNDFMDGLAFEGEEFLHLYTRDKRSDGTFDEALKIVCCDASAKLKVAHKEFANVVAFSATVKPFEYFSQLSGFESESVIYKEYLSPYPRENRKVLIIPQVSTKFSHREQNYGKIGEAICRITTVKPGNYLVFFPSFGFLREVFPLVKSKLGLSVELLKQEPEMTVAQQEVILKRLADGDADNPALLFAVQGGVFSEGVDYKGKMSIGALVVGPGLPNFNFEREQMRHYYEKRYGNGFDFAYVYPAMSKVVQAAGRVIRSSEDKGVIVLLDKRFLEKQYAGPMPADWYEKSAGELVSQSILQDLQEFWKSHDVNEVSSET